LPPPFPARLEHTPPSTTYPGENGRVHYGEGLFVGYRYYEKKQVAPLFPFGFGLSYADFEYSNLQTSAAEFTLEEGLTVSIDVTNRSQVAGKEVAQLYVHDVKSSLVRPNKELKGFAKVSLEPGQTKTITFNLNEEAFWFYNPAKCGWQTEVGAFEILVGASSQDIRQQTTVTLAKPEDGLTTASPIRTLLDDEHGRTVMERHFGAMLQLLESNNLLDQSIEQLANFAPDELTPEKMAEINADLGDAL
jgi:beta-glucosidase